MGEPLISGSRARHVVSILETLDETLDNPTIKNLFQFRKVRSPVGRGYVRLFTNGIGLGRGDVRPSDLEPLANLKNIHVKLLISLKGTYEHEFAALQGSGRLGKHLDQVKALRIAKELEARIGTHSLDVSMVLDLYHGRSYDIMCSNDECPAYSCWSPDLNEVVSDCFRNPNEILVEPVVNPYDGRKGEKGRKLREDWEGRMGQLLRAPPRFEPNLREGRNVTIPRTRIALEAYRKALQ